MDFQQFRNGHNEVRDQFNFALINPCPNIAVGGGSDSWPVSVVNKVPNLQVEASCYCIRSPDVQDQFPRENKCFGGGTC